MSARSPRFRPVLDSFTPYRPGRKPTGAGGRSFKLSSNESPYGPLPSVVGVIAAAATDLNRYPDHGSAELSAQIAARFGIVKTNVGMIVTRVTWQHVLD